MDQIVIHQARWVVPVTSPVIEQGAVAVAGDRILAVGKANSLCREYAGRCYDHGEGAILPGLVNAHIHLEFSALKGQIKPQPNLGSWLEQAMAGFAGLPALDLEQGVLRSLEELKATGTILVGEVSNTGQSLPLLQASSLEFQFFYECLGFDLLSAGPLEEDFSFFLGLPVNKFSNINAAAHAPYSVAANLFQRIAAWNRQHDRLNTVHLAESQEELLFCQQGDGFFKDLLIRRGRWREEFSPPGCSPVAYLDNLGFLDNPTLAVHGIWLTQADREILRRCSTWVVLCPRSNLFTGAGFPPLPELAQAGINLCLGTDSLASNHDLNLFKEMLTLHQHYPDFPLADLLALATWQGAQALGRGRDLGSLEPGKKAALLFVPGESEEGFSLELLEAGAEGKIFWLHEKVSSLV
jgi:cytosine/adenosine deaminase-related metal-dependent hydrolase